MAAFEMPALFRIRLAGAGETAARTAVDARRHRILIDEPAARGGTDRAASPLETLLAAYLGCTNVIAHIVAEEMGAELGALRFELEAELDTRGVFGKAEVAVPFPRIHLRVEAETAESEARIAELRAQLARRCPVAVILREAGVELIDDWRLVRPTR